MKSRFSFVVGLVLGLTITNRFYDPYLTTNLLRETSVSTVDRHDSSGLKISDTGMGEVDTPDVSTTTSSSTSSKTTLIDGGAVDADSSTAKATNLSPKFDLKNDEDEGISGCLIIKDDNSRLIEWIAYHYTVLPMKTLVAAVDHTSKTSPNEILRRWNNTFMEVYSWNFTEFIYPEYLGPNSTMEQRTRQQFFHEACFNFLKKKNKKWVTAVDTDEYVTFNRFTETDLPAHQATRDATLAKAANGTAPLTRQEEMILARTRIPPIDDPTTVWEFMQQEKNNPPWNTEGCVTMTRLMLGARENPWITQNIQATLPNALNATKLDTLRFFQHRAKGICKRNCKGKALLEVSRIPDEHLLHPVTLRKQYEQRQEPVPTKLPPLSPLGPHTPVLECRNDEIPNYLTSILRVQHYLGSEEAFFARKDYRGANRDKKFNWYRNLSSRPELEATHWVTHFIQKVGGVEQAAALLDGAGEVQFWKQQKLLAAAAAT